MTTILIIFDWLSSTEPILVRSCYGISYAIPMRLHFESLNRTIRKTNKKRRKREREREREREHRMEKQGEDKITNLQLSDMTFTLGET